MGYWYQDTAYSALSHTAAYTYDTVNRLSAAVATGNSAYNLTFNYKADGSNGQYGNMSCVQNGNTNGLCPQWTFGAGTNQITSSGFVYDAAGNLTTDVSGPYTRNYTWDAEGRLTQVNDNGGGTSTTYAYNALGQRAELVTTGWQLEGLFDTQGERVGYYSVASSGNVWLAAYVPFRGQELAEYSTGTSFAFMHTNALGSATMATMAWGAPGNDILYYPWGQEWQQLGGMYNTHFASMHAALQGSSLIDFTMYEATNRFYASNLGRWHSPDPLGGDITNPQSLNRYAYVMNNPTSMIDPLGLQGECFEYYCGPDEDIGGASWEPALWSPDNVFCGAQFSACFSNPATGAFAAFSSPSSGWLFQWLPNESVDEETGQPIGGFVGTWMPFFTAGSYAQGLSSNGRGGTANNGSWWSALKRIPWVVSWILPLGPLSPAAGVGPAGSIAWNPATQTLCGSVGVGASVGDNIAAGPVMGRTLNGQPASPSQINQIFSGWSVSGGINNPTGPVPVGPGVQGSANGSGVVYGPTVGVAGASVSSTYAVCVSF
jgi:RHS repeat-associated protein